MFQQRKIQRTRTHNAGKLERGQGLVEFAISIVFMMILLVGVLDLGRAFFSYLSVMDAAQEGAAYGAIEPTDVAGIRARVRSASSGTVTFVDLEDSDIDIRTDCCPCAGNAITITVVTDFTFVAPFIGGKTITLTGKATDTILAPPC